MEEEYNWTEEWCKKGAKQCAQEEKCAKTPEEEEAGGGLSDEEHEDAELRKGKRQLLPKSWESVGEAETESACARTSEGQQPSAAVVGGGWR